MEEGRKMSLSRDRVGEEKDSVGAKVAETSWRLRASVKSAMAALRTSVVVDVGMEICLGNQDRVSGWTTLRLRKVTQVKQR